MEIVENLEELLEAKRRFVDSRNNYQLLQSIMDGSPQGCQVKFSTFGSVEDRAFENAIESLDKQTAPGNRLNSSNLVLITNNGELTYYSYRDELLTDEDNPCCLVNILVHLRCEVFENFFISFHDMEGELIEKFDLGNEKVRIKNAEKHFSINNRTPQLYTFLVTSDLIIVFADGIQRASIALSGRKEPVKISVGLLGKAGSVSEASVLGMHVASGRHFKMQEYLQTEHYLKDRIETLIEEKKLKDAVAEIYLNELPPGDEIEEKLLNLIGSEITGAGTHNDWIYDYLKALVSDTFKSKYRGLEAVRATTKMVEVKNLTVELFRNPHLAMNIRNLIFNKSRDNSFSLYNGLSIDFFRGDRIGIIGANGAGKTTFLRTLAGLIPITQGEITIRGNYMLLKAGVGMRNELTGRENIYYAGGYLGLWGKELDKICEEVINFSELGSAIDRPYKYYSDGMKSRLVFSLATSVRPNILMLDELLSAGDISFKEKAESRLKEFMDEIDITIVVSHGLGFVANNCNKALYISKGGACYFGDPDRAISLYLEELRKNYGFDVEKSLSKNHIDE